MSKNNNVNPGQYKVGGRERQGEDVVQERAKMELTKNQEQTRPPKRAAARNEMLNGRSKSKSSRSSSR
jgi:hypothetical protein